MSQDRQLREHLVNLLSGGGAHIAYAEAVANLRPELRGEKPEALPFTPWRLIEHMRIAQWDILEFSRNPLHESPEWPDGYWPETDGPPDAKAWVRSIDQFLKDNQAMQDLVSAQSTDLYAEIPHGEGQTILREAMLVADHNAYHLGQLLVVRRLLGNLP